MIPMNTLPTWSPRVRGDAISRLYRSDAKGLLDEELLDDVAYGLYARALSILQATHAHSGGHVLCPACGAAIPRSPKRNDRQELLRCACGWELPWQTYFHTYHGKHLVGGAATQIVQNAADSFERCRSAEQKMRWIDDLIHAFHGQLQGELYRPVAVNFIDGNARQAIALIYSLAYGDGSPPDRVAQAEAWKRNLSQSYAAQSAPGVDA